jgi:peptide/nickel transport system substrate-binding protein
MTLVLPRRRALLRTGLAAAAASFAGPVRGQAGQAGATIRVAGPMPVGAIDPVTVSEIGGLLMVCQTSEFLCRVDPAGALQPVLAVGWHSDDHAGVWDFSLRDAVRFHGGAAFGAADVVATMERLCDPRAGSNALSALRGVLSPGGARAVDRLTVRFTLDAPCGHFPYFVSSDNYNAVMLPAAYRGGYERDFPGTGPFRLERFEPKSGARFVRNPDYWGKPALPGRTEFNFYAGEQPQIFALRDGEVDVIADVSAQGARGLAADRAVRLLRLRSAAHRQVHMDSKSAAFGDKRVRRALALSVDREGIVAGLYNGMAEVGNDSPFAPLYGATSAAIPQRRRDVDRARGLMRAAGRGDGFATVLVTEALEEMPDLAVVLQEAARDIGIRVSLRVEDPALYYGAARPGQSDWLDSVLGITDYGHRGVPDVMLKAPLETGGAWNAARFSDAAYDALVRGYEAATDAAARRDAADGIARLLLDETPVIVAAFMDYLVATAARVRGVQASAIGQIFLADAWLAA